MSAFLCCQDKYMRALSWCKHISPFVFCHHDKEKIETSQCVYFREDMSQRESRYSLMESPIRLWEVGGGWMEGYKWNGQTNRQRRPLTCCWHKTPSSSLLCDGGWSPSHRSGQIIADVESNILRLLFENACTHRKSWFILSMANCLSVNFCLFFIQITQRMVLILICPLTATCHFVFRGIHVLVIIGLSWLLHKTFCFWELGVTVEESG